MSQWGALFVQITTTRQTYSQVFWGGVKGGSLLTRLEADLPRHPCSSIQARAIRVTEVWCPRGHHFGEKWLGKQKCFHFVQPPRADSSSYLWASESFFQSPCLYLTVFSPNNFSLDFTLRSLLSFALTFAQNGGSIWLPSSHTGSQSSQHHILRSIFVRT